MKIEQTRWRESMGWDNGLEPNLLKNSANLVIFFSSVKLLEEAGLMGKLKNYYPKAEIVGCSSSGEVYQQEVNDNSLVILAIEFEKATIKISSGTIENIKKSKELGTNLLKTLPKEGLKHIFVLSDGLKVDGTELVEGFSNEISNANIGITGGLAADADRFERTRVYYNKLLDVGSAVAIGFYGESLTIGYSAKAGWKAYGPIRIATKADGPRLYELDGKPALQLYKDFLGPYAHELPTIGLLSPMSIWEGDTIPEERVARTIIGISEEDQSIWCAGGIPQNCHVQFMMTNIEQLVIGAETAAKNTLKAMNNRKPQLALLMTCMSRKMIMKQRVEEELEAVTDVIGKETSYIGFYTYGEISPFYFNTKCLLQNQMMAITAIRED